MLQTSLSDAHLLWLQRTWKMVFSIVRLQYIVSLFLRTESSEIGRRRKHYYTLPLHLPVLTGALKYFPIWSARIHALLFRKTLSYCKLCHICCPPIIYICNNQLLTHAYCNTVLVLPQNSSYVRQTHSWMILSNYTFIQKYRLWKCYNT